MRDAIFDVLDGDVTLGATLTGGVYTGVEISRQGTPGAFDANGEIEPCGLLRFSTETPIGPHDHSARLFFSVMFYERAGYTSIEAARARVYALLHRQRVTPGSGGCWEIRHSDDVLDVEDEALGCKLAISRFYAVVNRG
jgi:hypothetical protein